MVAGLVLMLSTTPSWGQPTDPVCAAPGCNPTITDGNGNTAGGSGALENVASMSGLDNTAFGAAALRMNTNGTDNTAFGTLALHDNTTGNNNTASGFQALQDNTTGTNNTASGGFALLSNTTGNLNTASGFQALQSNVGGANNTAVGAKALKKSLGTKNIGIGYQAGVTLTTGNNNIFIGNQGAGDESQTIRIGTAQTSTFMAGIATGSVSGATVEVDTTTGQLGIVTSSARFKRDIASMGSRSEKLLDLRPVTFAYRDDAHGVEHYGLIAEEVAAVYPQLVTHTATGEVQAVRYQELIPLLLNEVQRQRQALQSQEQTLTRQQQELEAVAMLRKELAELRALMGSRPGQQAASHAAAR